MDVSALMEMFVSYGFESDDEMTDEQKLLALNETYWDVCSREPWPWLETAYSFSFDGGDPSPNNPMTDLGAITKVWRSADGAVLSPVRFDDFIEAYGSNLVVDDAPSYYYIQSSNTVQFYPRPRSSDLVNCQYLRVPAELTELSVEADIVLPKRWHRGVLGIGTLARLALMQDDVDMSNAYERLYEKSMAMMVGVEFKKQYDRPEYIHAYDADNWDYS